MRLFFAFKWNTCSQFVNFLDMIIPHYLKFIEISVKSIIHRKKKNSNRETIFNPTIRVKMSAQFCPHNH